MVVSQQASRQAARREAMNALTQRRRERVEKDKRVDALLVAVMLALAERDAAVTAFELRAGAVLRRITDEEGLPLHDVVERCGDGLSVREATRLRRTAEPAGEADATAEASAVKEREEARRALQGVALPVPAVALTSSALTSSAEPQ